MELRDDILRLERNFKKINVDSQSFDSAYYSNYSASSSGSVDIEEKPSSGSSCNEILKSDLAAIPETGDCKDLIQPSVCKPTSEAKPPSSISSSSTIISHDEQDDGFFTQSNVDDLYNQDEDGDSVLHMAIIECDANLAEYYIINVRMLSCNHLLDLQNNLFQTPLHLAVVTKQYGIVELLVRNGASVDIRDNNGNTPLHVACRDGDFECVKMLLGAKNIKKSLNMLNYDGLTSIHLAALRKPYPTVSILLYAGANINVQDGKSGRTILHYAVESNDKILVYQLFKYPELNINAVTFGGVTAYCLADDQNNELMKNILRTNGASLFYRDSSSEDSDDDMFLSGDVHMDYQPS
ncbi:NF-kappa-B inhibitor cactus [Octopus vulgaris]|uniref:NF-kappa-B inhibitor cactus n=1 Tax=Octopus vulgaris TaxID=6645 RepID=A0AA36F8S3_OCTVU|nr:NF-kappa-B inhibitor cactus [Octopus vulgaris]